jgi:tetratricopeptide (TPR) repeat protein
LLYRNAAMTNADTFAHLAEEEQATIREIVRLFGYHPLAIFIAGNYISENRKTFARYLARLQKAEGKILKDERGVDAYQHPDIYSAFEIAFHTICGAENKTPEEQTRIAIARECMCIASILAPDKMPEELFWETAGLTNEDWKKYLADEDNRDKIYQTLAQYKLFERDGKLFERDGETETLTIHRLVKIFFAERLKTERPAVEEPLAEVLAKYFEHFDFTNKEKVEKFLPHVASFLEHLEESFRQDRQTARQADAPDLKKQLDLSLKNESTANLCNRYARYYEQNGKYVIAERYYECFKNICEEIKDIDQNLLALSYNNLAVLYQTQGRYEEAEPLYRKSLAIREKVLGENHPSTAESYLNLGGFYYLRGKAREGLELCEKALIIFRNTLPAGHPTIQVCEGWVEIIKNSMAG